MSRQNAIRSITATLLLPFVLTVATVAVAAGPYNLTFQGDTSFHGPHGGQTIHIAVLEADSGKVVASKTGTVSGSKDPAFSFTFDGVLSDGKDYDVDYWIDSNFGGGSSGTCDPKKTDHQWHIELGTVNDDVTHTEHHNPGKTTSVCDTFANL